MISGLSFPDPIVSLSGRGLSHKKMIVVLFFRSERNSRNALTICENPSVSRSFFTRSSEICGMECCVVLKW